MLFKQKNTKTKKKSSQVMLVVKDLPASARDKRGMGSIPGSGRSPGGGHGNPLQYSGLEVPMDRGVRWATLHQVTQSQMLLSDLAHKRKTFS